MTGHQKWGLTCNRGLNLGTSRITVSTLNHLPPEHLHAEDFNFDASSQVERVSEFTSILPTLISSSKPLRLFHLN